MRLIICIFFACSFIHEMLGINNYPIDSIVLSSAKNMVYFNGERLWPKHFNDHYKRLSKEYHTSLVLKYDENNIFILTRCPDIFFNDDYYFDSFDELQLTFTNAICVMETDDAPFYTYVNDNNGNKLIYTSIPDIPSHWFNLIGGQVKTNDLIRMSKFCRIGSTDRQLFSILGDFEEDFKMSPNYRIIVSGDEFYMNNNAEKIYYPGVKPGALEPSTYIIFTINDHKIVSIQFEGGILEVYWKYLYKTGNTP